MRTHHVVSGTLGAVETAVCSHVPGNLVRFTRICVQNRFFLIFLSFHFKIKIKIFPVFQLKYSIFFNIKILEQTNTCKVRRSRRSNDR